MTLKTGTMRQSSWRSSKTSEFIEKHAFTTILIPHSKAIELEQTSLADLAYRLEGPMQANSDHLKQYLAHTLAPVARQVKDVHRNLDEKVDVGFGSVSVSSQSTFS